MKLPLKLGALGILGALAWWFWQKYSPLVNPEASGSGTPDAAAPSGTASSLLSSLAPTAAGSTTPAPSTPQGAATPPAAAPATPTTPATPVTVQDKPASRPKPPTRPSKPAKPPSNTQNSHLSPTQPAAPLTVQDKPAKPQKPWFKGGTYKGAGTNKPFHKPGKPATSPSPPQALQVVDTSVA